MALRGLRVVELHGLAPVPFAGMILRDFGARVIEVDKAEIRPKLRSPPDVTLARGKESLALNLKHPDGAEIMHKLVSKADILLDPFRPGVLERLGLGPDELLARNPRLIYARLSGYGQQGPLSMVAGHDINYVAMSGMLSMLGRHGSPPTPPGNILADIAGGALTCVLGVLMAVIERGTTGKGQVVDCSMTEGTAYLGSFVQRARQAGMWGGPRGQNMLDSGCPFYDTYQTQDGKWIALGCLEPQFYQEFISRLGPQATDLPTRDDPSNWGALRKVFTETIQSKTRDQWEAIYKDTDACVTPVLDLEEWSAHPHTVARQGQLANRLPTPAPRLVLDTDNGMAVDCHEPEHGQHTLAILQELGYGPQEAARLVQASIVASSQAQADTP